MEFLVELFIEFFAELFGEAFGDSMEKSRAALYGDIRPLFGIKRKKLARAIAYVYEAILIISGICLMVGTVFALFVFKGETWLRWILAISAVITLSQIPLRVKAKRKARAKVKVKKNDKTKQTAGKKRVKDKKPCRVIAKRLYRPKSKHAAYL